MKQSGDKLNQRATFSDVAAALGLLSRLPIVVDTDRATARGAMAAWAYPVAGLVLALIACAVGQVLIWIGLPSPLIAGAVIATFVTITGCMHEDGLADAADGLWGGWDKDRRLAIMKDSHIGAYGVIALILGLGLRWQALGVVIAAGALWPVVIVTAMFSRAMMVPVMARLPHARDGGLSHAVGRPDLTTARIAEIIALGAALLLLLWTGVIVAIVAVGATVACAKIAKAKIGGQTGDILGATQQVVEISVLIALAALLG